MSDTTSLTPVMVERASEQLRQEKETFDQQKKQEHLWFISTFGATLLACRFCGNRCGNRGRARNRPLATAFYQHFITHERAEKNLRLHKSRALTFHGLQLGSLMSTVERVSQK